MTSPKTTVIGIIAAIVFAIPGLQQLVEQGITTGNWKEVVSKLVAGLVVGVLGYFAKDHDVTGAPEK